MVVGELVLIYEYVNEKGWIGMIYWINDWVLFYCVYLFYDFYLCVYGLNVIILILFWCVVLFFFLKNN